MTATAPNYANRSVVRIVLAVLFIVATIVCGVLILMKKGNPTDETGLGLIAAALGIAALCL